LRYMRLYLPVQEEAVIKDLSQKSPQFAFRICV
jgi:hypothetical protein